MAEKRNENTEKPSVVIYDEEELTPEHARRQEIFEQTLIVDGDEEAESSFEMTPLILMGTAFIIVGLLLLGGMILWNIFLA